jgi:AcrR family transcriptional regulator
MARGTTPARGRRREARGQVRESILAAADEFLRERPFRELTIDELMKRAGLSRTLFYRHFDDLGHLLTELLWSVGGDLRQSSDLMVESGADADAIRSGLTRLVEWFARNGPLIAAVVDATSYDEEIERIYDEVLARWVERTRVALEQAAAGGHIVPVDRSAAEALVCLNERYLLRKLGHVPQADPAEVEATLWSVWSRYMYGPDRA